MFVFNMAMSKMEVVMHLGTSHSSEPGTETEKRRDVSPPLTEHIATGIRKNSRAQNNYTHT